jgi:hypothetical protein
VLGGNCAAYTTTLEVVISNDATLRFFQPDTGDLNIGVLWLNADGEWEFYVNNDDHPESWVGIFDENFSKMSGENVWNNQCRQNFQGA